MRLQCYWYPASPSQRFNIRYKAGQPGYIKSYWTERDNLPRVQECLHRKFLRVWEYSAGNIPACLPSSPVHPQGSTLAMVGNGLLHKPKLLSNLVCHSHIHWWSLKNHIKCFKVKLWHPISKIWASNHLWKKKNHVLK